MKNKTIDCAIDAAELIAGLAKKRQEHFGIICVDSGRELLSKKVLFVGNECNALIHPKIIFWEACKKQASAIIVFHNHPGGRTAPSKDDIETTERLMKACDLMAIQFLDHIIIGKYDYFSFKEHGMIDAENCKLKVAEAI